jgi:hypothetical protein
MIYDAKGDARNLTVLQSDGSYMDSYGACRWFNEEGRRHREEGPAVISPNSNMGWWLNGLRYSFNMWCIELNKTDEAKMMLRLQYE